MSFVNKEKVVVKLKICTLNCIFVERFSERYTFYLPFIRVEWSAWGFNTISQVIFFWQTIYWRPWKKQLVTATRREELLIYHRWLTNMRIVKGFVLIRSMMNQGKSSTGQFDDSCLLLIYVLGLEVLINSLYFYLNFYFYLIIDRYNSIYAYGQSKLSNILHANELARRLKVLNA